MKKKKAVLLIISKRPESGDEEIDNDIYDFNCLFEVNCSLRESHGERKWCFTSIKPLKVESNAVKA